MIPGRFTWAIGVDWARLDNHKYLLLYLCLSLAAVAANDGRPRLLADNARLLIGLAFALATCWKATSLDYLDGRFFTLALIEDSRFEGVARWVASASRSELLALRDSLAMVRQGGGAITLDIPIGLRVVAMGLTAWTVAIEAVIALAFLAPTSWRVSAYRHILLLLFGLTTYAVAPVTGFGWVLMILGLAQCDRESAATRLAYVGVYVTIGLYSAPWSEALLTLGLG